jgi:predicted ATP-dependent endonuclease of OLD family
VRYTTFEINKYRAIDYAKVAVSNSLIPIIGVNESGKTTVLHAILAFDKSKDKYNDGKS